MFRKDAGSNGIKIGPRGISLPVRLRRTISNSTRTICSVVLVERMGKRGEEEEESPKDVRFSMNVSKGGNMAVMQCRSRDDGVGL